MSLDYRKLVDAHPLAVHESSRGYQLFTERHLQAIWLEQRYFKGLTTTTGKTVDVISPGIWNAEAGPDFLKAHLRIDGQEIKGAVELHLTDEGWEQHGHHIDPRYQQVVLHLSLWKSKQAKQLYKFDGNPIPCVHFEDCLTVPLARLTQLIDLDLYPYKQFVGSGKCSQLLFRQLPSMQVKSLFVSAALWRLHQKERFLQARCSDRNEQLLAGFAMALGYKANAQAFLDLFLWLRAKKSDLTDEACLAAALGTSGFFSSYHVEKWGSSSYYQSLKNLWTGELAQTSPRFPVVVIQQRPFNHPVRRLAAVALLVQDMNNERLFQDCDRAWSEGWESCWRKERWKPLYQWLLERLPSYADVPYWSSHYIFESHQKSDKLVLVGGEVKSAVLVNTVLPLLSAQILERQNPAEQAAFHQFYQSLKSSDSGKLRYLTHRFFGETPKGDLMKAAIMGQGAFQVHHDFCVHYEASCEGCPFVERVKQGFLT